MMKNRETEDIRAPSRVFTAFPFLILDAAGVGGRRKMIRYALLRRRIWQIALWATIMGLYGATQGVLDGGNGGQGPSRDHIFGTKRPIGGLTEKIEGCFDRFDSEFSVHLEPTEMNNKRCQAICTDHGYSLAATRLDDCFCGNDYPSVFHRMDTGLCDFPCSPDHASCFSFTCCGSRNGRFLTVSWSGEQDIMLRILRQLSHDYRLNSPQFKAKIEGTFGDGGSLTLLPDTVQQGMLPPKYLSIGDGCPNGWSLYDRWCYKTHYAEPKTYKQAVKVCQYEGGDLVTVSSEGENTYLTELQGGCQGWLGMRGYSMSSRPIADVKLRPSNLTLDNTTVVAVSEEWRHRSLSVLDQIAEAVVRARNGSSLHDAIEARRHKWDDSLLPGLWGPKKRQKWREKHAKLKWVVPQFRAWSTLSADVAQSEVIEGPVLGGTLGQRFEHVWSGEDGELESPRRLVVEYSDAGLLDFRTEALESQPAPAPNITALSRRPLLALLGGDSQRGTQKAVIDLGPDDELLGIMASVGLRGLRALSVVTRQNGSRTVHGPFGEAVQSMAGDMAMRDLLPDQPISGIYGFRSALGHVRGLGLKLQLTRSCSRMNETGGWVTAPCFQKEASAQPFICEKRSGVFTLGCPRGWVPYDASCYRRGQAEDISWWDARVYCQEAGGHLAAISSVAENAFVQKLLSSAGPSSGYIGHFRARSQGHPWVWDSFWKGPANDDAMLPFDGHKRQLGEVAEDGEEEKEELKCFEMIAGGAWQPVSCLERPSKSRVVLCERGAPDQTCNCSSFEGLDGDMGMAWDGPWVGHGCLCYRQMVTGGGSVTLSWVEAQAVCGSLGARLVSVGSKEENEWVRSRFEGALFFRTGAVLSGYLGLNNLHDKDSYQWTYYQNWRQEHANEDKHGHDHHEETHDADQDPATAFYAHPQQAATTTAMVEYSPERPEVRQKGHCGQMGRDGKWIRASCAGQTSSCFVCKRQRSGPFVNAREGYGHEQWHVDVLERDAAYSSNGWRGPWCVDCFPAYLRHASTGQYLCVDGSNLLFMSWAKDPAWCLLTLVLHHKTGAMAIVTTHGAALFYDHDKNLLYCDMLKGRAAPPLAARLFHPLKEMERKYADRNSTESSWSVVALHTDGVAKFHSSSVMGQIAWRYLRISIAAQSRDLMKVNIKECSLGVYDTSPNSDTYECHLRVPGLNDDLVSLEQEALLFFDQSTFAAPRVPLPNGRVRCENQSPTETGTCTFAYGQGLTLSRQFRANWGYTISDVMTHRVNAAPTQTALFRIPPRTKQRKEPKPLGKHLTKLGFKRKTNKPTPQPQVTDVTLSISELKEFINAFSVAYNNFYEILITKSYVETRNWQMSVPVAPRTTDTIQFWLSSENLRYRWRALFAARGGFTISIFGQPIGDNHSLGDLSYFRDLFFFIFGTYEFPYEAEIIITVNDIPGDGWPLPLPETSQGDRIKDVARNGQIGFGYGSEATQYDGGGLLGHGGGKAGF